jgi:hypothetical protein
VSTILYGCREDPGVEWCRVDASPFEGSCGRRADHAHVVGATHLGDETTTRPQGTIHRTRYRLDVGYPIQHSVAKDGVKRLLEREGLRAVNVSVRASQPGSRDLLGTAVSGHNATACGDQLLTQCAVTAAEVENALTPRRGNNLKEPLSQVRNETSVPRIYLGIPKLL